MRAALTDGDRLANLTLTVTPGPHVRVVFTGDVLPADKRAELVPIEREGSVDEDLLEDATNAIVELPAGPGLSRRDGAAFAHRVRERAADRLRREARSRIPGRSGRNLRQCLGAVVRVRAALRLRDGEPFAEARLDADLATIQDLYRRRGFAAARVQAAEEPQRVEPRAPFVPLRVRMVISEGVRTLVSAVRLQGNAAVSEAELKTGLGLQPGRPYVDTQLVLDRDAIQLHYLNLGYQNVTVDANPNFSADRTLAEPIFTIREGPRIFVDHVLIVGNVRTGLETIERELQMKPGEALSEAAKIESRRRLAALGLFRRVQIAELAHGDETRRDLLVTVEEGPVTTVIVGGGAEGRLRPVRSAEGGIVSEQFDLGAARLVPDHPPESLRQESIDQRVHQRQPEPEGLAGVRRSRHADDQQQIPRVSGARHLPRAAAVRHGGRCVHHRHDRAADSIQLQLRPEHRRRRLRPPPFERDQLHRQLSDSAHARLRFAGAARKTSR